MSNVIFFGKKALQRAMREYGEHYHHERNHQGRENVLIFPSAQSGKPSGRSVKCRERLGGLLKYYYRKAA